MVKRIFTVVALASLALSASVAQAGLSLGIGHTSNFRVGPGKDSSGTQVYSLNYVYAAVVFDAKGKIVDLEVDGLEVSTPNYDGSSMPHFSGWPGSPEPNLTDHASGKVAGTSPTTVEAVNAEVAAWKTKRDRGDEYGITENTKTNPKADWHKQMDNFEKLFKGKTVEELDAWFAKYVSDVNGRLIDPATTNEKDKAKVAKLNAADKKMLVDARTGASMSVKDAHGNIVDVIRDAYNKRKPLASK